jgi:hypothetical protein
MSDMLSKIDAALSGSPVPDETPAPVWEKVSASLYTAVIGGIEMHVKRSGQRYAVARPGTDVLIPVRTVAEGKAAAESYAAERLAQAEDVTDDQGDDFDAFVPGTFAGDGTFTADETPAADDILSEVPDVPTAQEVPAPVETDATAGLRAQVEALQAQLAAMTAQQVPVAFQPAAEPDRSAIIDDAMASGRHPETRPAGNVYDALSGWHVNDVMAQGQEVAGEVRSALMTYMKFPDALAEAYAGTLTLWALHTHVFYHQGVTPYLMISSPTAGAGKSTLISILSRVVRQPAVEVNPTAAVARTLAGEGYTLLLDEVDELDTGKDFKSILNAGYKHGGAVSRIKGNAVQRDVVFSPKLLAGIGREGAPIEGALLDRCIQVWLERATPGERPWFDTELISELLRERVVLWARNAVCEMARHPADMPALPSSRSLEIWGPLVAVADALGGDWGRLARNWAVEIESRKETQADPNVQILTDTREVMLDYLLANPHESSITAERLLEMRNGFGSRQFTGSLTAVSFGKRLSRFGIKTTPVRGVRVFKIGDGFGNLLPEIQQIFARYCD